MPLLSRYKISFGLPHTKFKAAYHIEVRFLVQLICYYMCVREINRQFLCNRKEKQYAFYNLPDTHTDFMPSRDADT